MNGLRLAYLEIRNSPRFALFFAVNLAIGLTGFAALDAFDHAVASELVARSRSFMGADLVVQSSRPLEAEEARRFDGAAGRGALVSPGARLFSMAGGGERARLVEVRAIDGRFPHYGMIELEGAGPAGDAERARFLDTPGAWLDPALVEQLEVKVGGQIRIGQMSFQVIDTVARDTGRATSGFSIAPRIYLPIEHLPSTGLIDTGSRIEYQRFYRLSEGVDVEVVTQRFRSMLDDERVRVQSHLEATRSLARAYGAVASYLGLVSCVAVFLAGLGAAYLFRSFLLARLHEIAILMSLGASRARAQSVFMIQLWCLAGLATGIACGLAAALLPAVAAAAADFLPPGATLGLEARTLAVTFALAWLGSTAACLPLVARIRSLKPASLFREHTEPSLEQGPRDVLLLIPALVTFWAFSVWRAESLEAGSLFVAVFATAMALLALSGRLLFHLIARLPRPSSVSLRLALRRMARGTGGSLANFVTISLCALLVSLAPQLRAALSRDLDPPKGPGIPSLFLFDIQPEQVDPLREHVKGQGSVLQRLSPMVRARLTGINGVDNPAPAARRDTLTARRAREGREAQLRTRRYNLTYAEALSDSEKLVEGTPFMGPFEPVVEGPAQLSLEVHFADELGVGLGDVLDFDVQGVRVSGQVVNLREVRWNSLQPNFFVTFQPGVLEEAPQILIASIPRLSPTLRESLQGSITQEFPNVSIIDVTRSVERLLGLLKQLEWALTSTAAFSVFVGLVLVFAIARDQARTRRWETNLLKVLGAEFGQIRAATDFEFGLLSLFASLAGVTCSALSSALLSRLLLESDWAIDWWATSGTVVAIPLICVFTARFAGRSVLRERPLALLQSQLG
ncbi:hypothetical protein MK489_00405 [Myxococcota bacterium]|nr:hypothetical protein [Myxococcota bacterium]